MFVTLIVLPRFFNKLDEISIVSEVTKIDTFEQKCACSNPSLMLVKRRELSTTSQFTAFFEL